MPGFAVVTGASSGIGEAYAERLAAEGWDLVIVARRVDRLRQTAARLSDAHGVKVRSVRTDLSRVEEIQPLCDELRGAAVEMLINNAALAYYMPFAELPAESARELVELDALAPVMLTEAVLGGMLERGGGTVINVASLLAFSGTVREEFFPARAVYAASKSFLVTFSQLLAAELENRGVQVQVVCPGIVRSEFHSRQGMDLSRVPRMEPEQVVEASFADLAEGVVVSVPGLADTGALGALARTQEQLLSAARAAELPPRYRRQPAG